MRPVKCNNCKKFFDADKYEKCPHCNIGESSFAAPPVQNVQIPPQQAIPKTDDIERKVENFEAPVVVQCELCKKYYDSNRDKVCPHCNGIPAVPAKEEKEEFEADNEAYVNETPAVNAENENLRNEVYSQTENEIAAESKAEAVEEKEPEPPVAEPVAVKIPEAVATPEFVQPVSISEAVKKAESVPSNDALERYADSKTVAFYDLSNDVEPVVGWLVGLKGEYKGVSFNLKSGRNYIGRSLNMDVALAKENTVSRERHSIISFDPKQKKFFVQSGESRGLTYVNGELLMSYKEIGIYDVISLGACDLMFIPLCSDRFSWENIR